MPPRAKAAASLAGMIDSDEEQPNADVPTAEASNQENEETVAITKGKSKAKGARKTKPAAKRLSAGKPKTVAARKTSRRAASKTQASEENATEEETDNVEATPKPNSSEAPATAQKITEKAPPKRKGRPPKKATESAKEEEPVSAVKVPVVKDGEFEYTPTAVRQIVKGRPRAKKTAQKPKGSTEEQKIASPDPEDELNLDQSIDHDSEDDLLASDLNLDLNLDPTEPLTSCARSISNPPPSYPNNPRKRALSTTSSTNNNDHSSAPALRRKLGDITNRYTSLETRYKNLHSIGIKEAEANFQRLQKTTDQRHKAAEALIAGLRREVATQRSETEGARAHLPELENAREEVVQLRAKLGEAQAELGDVQAENKALQARLVASRSAAAANVEAIAMSSGPTKGPPGSAVKAKAGAGGTNGGTRTMMGGVAAEAVVAAAQVAQLKEELYGDLTGLIIRGVERGEEGEVGYDCIQTGRNGTLHFKLALSAEPGVSFDETEFSYMPRLDANRDRDLIAVLPEYLSEDITFSRPQAAKFYSRVVDTLTRRTDE